MPERYIGFPGILKTGAVLVTNIANVVRRRLSPLAMPQEIEFVDKAPKARSGKILRRVLKAKELGQPVGDVSTMKDDQRRRQKTEDRRQKTEDRRQKTDLRLAAA